MKYKFLFFLITTTTWLGAQLSPQKVERLQRQSIISEHKVKKRIALVYQYTDSSFYNNIGSLRADTQSVTKFNKSGQITEVRQFRDYASTGKFIFKYSYDHEQRLITKRDLVGDSIAKEEQFVYSPGGALLDWTIIIGNNKVNQEYSYNEHHDPTIILAKDSKGRTLRKDSICYLYDSLGRAKYEWSINQKGERADEVVYRYNMKDTVWKKILLIEGLPTTIYAKVEKQGLTFDLKTDIVVFEDGWLLATRTKTFDRHKNLIQERLRHPSVEWNYTKNFIYNKDGLLVEKQVFEDTQNPTTVVLYSYEYFED